MDFKTYFRATKATHKGYSEKINVNISTVGRLLNGSLATRETMLAIYVESAGLVEPNDWYPEIMSADLEGS